MVQEAVGSNGFVSNLLVATGFVITVLLAYLQLQKSHRATLYAQEEHLRNELKLRIYERVSAVFADVNAKIREVRSAYQSTLSALQFKVQGHPVSFRFTPLELNEKSHAAANALSRVLTTLEEYEIIFVRFGAIRRQIVESHQRILETHMQLFHKLLPFLSSRDERTGNLLPPLAGASSTDLDEIKALERRYDEACGDLTGFMIDLQIETQNELLGPLFQRELPPRHPADPTIKVIRRDDVIPRERPKGRLV